MKIEPLNPVQQYDADSMAQIFKRSMAELVLDRMMDRTTDGSKRASRDSLAAIGVLKGYESRGGKL